VTAGSRYEAVARMPPYDQLGDRIILRDEPERAWRLMMALLHAVDEDVFDYAGAGPLEDFIRRYGARLPIRWKPRRGMMSDSGERGWK
jgi:hypothetical protein